MEIRIDTTKDSKEDIIKAISFLKSIVGEIEQQPQQSNTAKRNEEIFAAKLDMFAVAKESSAPEPEIKRKKSPEEELFGDDSIRIIPY